ncbi:MAG: formylglycine-generating enzyme family protein [Saprospiraceae bacterium]|nr:formylglycine-generating enzyme family protein [Saprospiraceae bacterium]
MLKQIHFALLAASAWFVFTTCRAQSAYPELVLIPGGNYEMGSNESGNDDEKPAHQVTISDFYLGKYEVTVAQFRAFVEATGYKTDAEKSNGVFVYGKNVQKKTGIDWRYDPSGNLRPKTEENHPVLYVSWNDAVAYCAWLSQKTGQKHRLPTEAEWEYAAGNGSKHTKYSWGNDKPSATLVGNLPDTSIALAFGYNGIFPSYNDGFALTSPVGTFPANTFGLYDMSGNLMEWCSDWMDWDYYQKSPSNNPAGPSYGNDKITRGGSWCIYPDFCKVIHRYVESPNEAFGTVGFRVARSR